MFNLREFYLPANFISIVIGLELAGYFLYQYNKLKAQKMGIDKFLLAFGIFFCLTFTGTRIWYSRMTGNTPYYFSILFI